eukprot:GFYU01016226.1.p1 GENE.GFYU01016226.1~~GFYU01016226.1.p1  ORF type:complete len:144 (-),score=51.66 GFYU01016226.1:261-692(-)
MVNRVKPGGSIFIGTLNDPEKRDDPNNEQCHGWHGGDGHFFIAKQFWKDNLDKLGCEDLKIVDETDACSSIFDVDRCRYMIYMKKKSDASAPAIGIQSATKNNADEAANESPTEDSEKGQGQDTLAQGSGKKKQHKHKHFRQH